MTSNLSKPMTKEESYVQRRQLFKNIWDTALQVDGKEDILSKPKVVKTLKMDEIDRCPVGKSKKQRIKNLRHVCKRILDFCNQQEAVDDLHIRMSPGAESTCEKESELKPAGHANKKTIRVKKKHHKAKSTILPAATAASSQKLEKLPWKTTTLAAMVENENHPIKALAHASSSVSPSMQDSRCRVRLVKNKKEVKHEDIEKLVFSLDPTTRKVNKKKRVGHGRKKKKASKVTSA